MEQKVRNPETGRWIRKKGALYKKLLSTGAITGKEESKKAPVYKPPTGYTVVSHNAPYPVDRGTASWKMHKPERKPERTRVLEKCGESCFLLPKELKFPICNKEVPPCEYSCEGLKAASRRAGEWKYTRALEKSKQLTTKLGCTAAEKKKKATKKTTK